MPPAAPAAPAAAPAAAGASPTKWQTLRSGAGTAASVVGNGLLYGGAGAAGVAAAHALSNAGAPKANPAVVPGERQPGDSGLSHLIPGGHDPNQPAPPAQPYNFWTDTDLGRNIGNTANAIAPLGGVAMAARVPGALTRTAGLADAAITGLAGGVQAVRSDNQKQTTLGTNNPYADANARKIAESDAKNAAGAPAPGGYDPNQSRPDPGYGPIGDRTTLTNEQAAIMNPAGRVTMTRGANGNMEFSGGDVSGQVSYNDASGKAYAGGGLPLPGGGSQGFFNFDVAPAGADVVMGPGGYAFATSGSGVRGQGGSAGGAGGGGAGGGYTSDGIDTRGLRGPQADQYAAEVRQARAINQASQRGALHSGNDWESRNTLRNLEFDASTKLGGRKIYQNAVAMDQLKRAGADPGSVARTTADASRYGSDSSLHGQMYSADAQRGGKQAETQQKLREQQLMGALWKAADGNPAVFQNLAMRYGLADAAKQGGDMVGAQQTRAKANSEDAQSTFKGLFTDKENKRDEHAEAQAHQLASQIVPGWENMNPEQRNANRAKVVDATRAVQGMNKLRNNGWGQAIGWDAPTPEYSQLPDLNGATVGDVGFLEGAARKDVSKNDTKITLRNGEVRFLPAGTLSEAQLRMMQENGATRSTR